MRAVWFGRLAATGYAANPTHTFPMDDSNQIEVPPSFLALFVSPSGQRLTQPADAVRQRYELCEDLAQMLAGDASATLFKSEGSEREVLGKIRTALMEPGSAVQPAEASWVVARLAELLGWDLPDSADATEPR
jgi:hypothetical protein